MTKFCTPIRSVQVQRVALPHEPDAMQTDDLFRRVKAFNISPTERLLQDLPPGRNFVSLNGESYCPDYWGDPSAQSNA